MAKTTAGTRAAKPANRPGARGAEAREGAPQGRPADRSVRAQRPRTEAPAPAGDMVEIVRVRVRDDVPGGMVYYDNQRRRVGDVFDLLDPKHFNPSQHEKVHSRTKLRATTARHTLAKAHDDVLAQKYAMSRGQGGNDSAPDDLEAGLGNPLDDE